MVSKFRIHVSILYQSVISKLYREFPSTLLLVITLCLQFHCTLIEPVNSQDDDLLFALAFTPSLTGNAACGDVFSFNDRDEDSLSFVRQVGLEPGTPDRFRIFSPQQEVFYGYELVTGAYKIFIYGLGSLSPRLQVCNRRAQPRAKSRLIRNTGVRYVSAEVPSAPPLPPQEVDEDGNLIPRPPEDLEGSRIDETTNMRVNYIAPLYIDRGLGFYTISLHTPESVRTTPFSGAGSCVTDTGCFQYETGFSNARRHCEFLNGGTFSAGNCAGSARKCSGALNEGLVSFSGGTRARCDEIFGANDAYFWED